MDAVSISVRGTGEWVIIHRCSVARWVPTNRQATTTLSRSSASLCVRSPTSIRCAM
ncbi:hypothetical protein AB0H60_27685 [Nocardia rhamnosiphila]|uniref:hypothetical protein n=1 Tax=Nocardia rhamnosiphila TaxID=426716 RepID=UPI0023E2077D